MGKWFIYNNLGYSKMKEFAFRRVNSFHSELPSWEKNLPTRTVKIISPENKVYSYTLKLPGSILCLTIGCLCGWVGGGLGVKYRFVGVC